MQTPAQLERDREERMVGEHRCPMALAVLAAIGLTFVVPVGLRVVPSWVIPLVEGVLLVALVIADPGRIDRVAQGIRWLSIGLVAVLLWTSLSFTERLIDDLVNGAQVAKSASELQLNPTAGWEDWRPHFVDYLYLGFTNATAFSPTDVMPLAPWAKMAMLVQSLVSLTILSLVIANAVNLFK